MGKDPQKYLYITIGLLRGSKTEQRLLADAEQHHMIEHTGKLAGLRLTEFYELLETGQISPSLFAALGQRGGAISEAAVGSRSLPGKGGENGDGLPISDGADSNAEAAEDYWSAL